ncbi:TPA: zinc ribbon domain-containing protein [bacterium]|nr:zinc ribbon domain-containing protein [bacterium]
MSATEIIGALITLIIFLTMRVFVVFFIAIWVYSDAKKRGKSRGSAFLWFLGTFLLLIVFLPIWLITRPKLLGELPITRSPQLCPYCGKYYEGNPSYCPNCGHELKSINKNAVE